MHRQPSPSFMAFTILVFLFLSMGGPVRPQASSGRASAKSGKAPAAADPALIDLAGYNEVIAKHRGKPLVVNFWATWCEPCRFEYPTLVELAKQYAPKGIAVVGVSMDDDADINLVRRFLARNQPGFPNYRQKPGIDLDSFYRGVNPAWNGTMPVTIFYGPDGHILGQFIGTRPPPIFQQAFQQLLALSGGRSALGQPSK